jgi:hypothetical protein
MTWNQRAATPSAPASQLPEWLRPAHINFPTYKKRIDGIPR